MYRSNYDGGFPLLLTVSTVHRFSIHFLKITPFLPPLSPSSDVITWSPQGRIKQIEYGMEAVKLGSCCLAVRSDTHV